MKYFQLPNGDAIPALGLGTYLSPPEKIETALLAAVNAGYRHIDCAHVYGNEKEIGAALQKVFEICPREELWITSKLWCDSHAPDAVQPALNTTLANLQLEYLDLYLVHWPVAVQPGVGLPQRHEDYISLDDIPLLDTWRAMEDCLEKRLVRNIGVSNFSTKKLADLLAKAAVPPAVNQIEIHPYQQQRTQVEFCRAHNITLTAYCPLGSTGSHITTPDNSTPSPLLRNPTIVEIARQYSITPAQLLLAWLMEQGIVAIPKSVTPSRIEENVKACEVTLDESIMKRIEKLDLKARIIDGTAFTGFDSPYTLENLWDGE